MFGKLISTLVVNAVKSTAKSSLKIDELIAKLKELCPPNQELQKIIDQKNKLSEALALVQTNLSTLDKIKTTADGIISTVDPIITVIKSLPIPTSAPPGIGVPINVITKLSDTLELLKYLLQQGKVSVKGITEAFSVISSNITKIQSKLNQLDTAILICASQTEFTGSLASDIGVVGITSNPEVNAALNSELESRLSPNSPNPLTYKEWTLILEIDPNNKFSFPRRRVIAQKSNPEGNGIITLISDFGPPGSNGYSYSSDTQVLVNDIQFKIDNPNWRPGSVLTILGEIQAENEALTAAALAEAAVAAEEARRQAEEARRGKVIFFGQTGTFENLPIGNFDGYGEGFYPVTNQVEGMDSQYSQGSAARTISAVRVGRGMRITLFYNEYFLTKQGLPENSYELQTKSRISFEHPLDAEEDFLETYVGNDFNDHVDSFIIDRLPGGTVTEFPPERSAIYEPTWLLKRRSKKQLYNVNQSLIGTEFRFDGYVQTSPSDNKLVIDKNLLNENQKLFLIYVRGFNEEEAINKVIGAYSSISWFKRWNFFTSTDPNEHIIKYKQIPSFNQPLTPSSYFSNSNPPSVPIYNIWIVNQWNAGGTGYLGATGGQFYMERLS